MNDGGQIAGTTITGAFILDGNNYRDWSDYGAFGNNQSGEVVGYKVGKNPYQPRSLPYNPAIYSGNKWEVLDIAGIYPRGTREGVYADRFILNGINADGYAVGYKYRYGLAGSAAILIDPNVAVRDLSDVIYLPTPAGGSAADINDNGDIVGNGFLNGEAHGFLLTNGTISEPPPAQNQPPVAVASADVYSGKAPLVVTFDSSGSTDPDGTVVGYHWDFMDGSFSTEANPSHEFATPDSYMVTLTVTDDQGMQASSAITITVRKGKRK